jgi:hypothetical protein
MFNGPHSLLPTIARCEHGGEPSAGALPDGERNGRFRLERIFQHAETTARYNVFFGEGRDAYDIRGRVAHESIFNLNDGSFRCPNSQQGFAPFTTWTRGQAWILAGYPEQMELSTPDAVSEGVVEEEGDGAPGGFGQRPTSDRQTPLDGIPWDTGFNLWKLGDYRSAVGSSTSMSRWTAGGGDCRAGPAWLGVARRTARRLRAVFQRA